MLSVGLGMLNFSPTKGAGVAAVALYPNCDLVLQGTPKFERDAAIGLKIRYSWERKAENYEKIQLPIAGFFIRYGPMDGDMVAKESETIVFMAKPAGDEITLTKVRPCKTLGLQICAITDKYFFYGDAWQRAAIYRLDLTEQLTPEEKKMLADEEKFYPNCDLADHIQSSPKVEAEKQDTGLMTMRYSWEPKKSNYAKIGNSVLAFVVRYGNLDEKGEFEEHLTSVVVISEPEKNNSITLKNLVPHKRFGLQICGVTSDFPFKAEAWEHARTDTIDLKKFWDNESKKWR